MATAKPRSIEDAVDIFRRAAIDKDRLTLGEAALQDRLLYETLETAHAYLRGVGSDGLDAFVSLLHDESPAVRGWVASQCLAEGDESVIPILYQLAGYPGLFGGGFQTLLRQYEQGRPPSGFRFDRSKALSIHHASAESRALERALPIPPSEAVVIDSFPTSKGSTLLTVAMHGDAISNIQFPASVQIITKDGSSKEAIANQELRDHSRRHRGYLVLSIPSSSCPPDTKGARITFLPSNVPSTTK